MSKKVEEIGVVNAETVVVKKTGTVTMKTLASWIEQTKRICNDKELVNNEVMKLELTKIMDIVKENFIKSKF